MRRRDVADVGDALVGLLALKLLGRRRQAPARHGELTDSVGPNANDRSGLIRDKNVSEPTGEVDQDGAQPPELAADCRPATI
jgi:hypothetical protein